MLTRRRLQTVGMFLVLSAAASVSVPARQGQLPPTPDRAGSPDIGEPPDIALRRLMALQDMYGTPTQQTNERRSRAESGVGRAARARPALIEFGIAPDLRLEALRSRGERLPGTIRRLPTENAPAFPATNLGPTNVSGRVSAVAVHPTNPAIIYRGTAGGGLWKTIDGGTTWAPLTDNLGSLSIGAVALAPSNPDIVYLGTGEGVFSVDGIDGIGLIRSTDGGATWSLPASGSVPKFFALSVHPTNPNEVLAATSKGILKSTDGGATWQTTFSTHVATALARLPGTPSTVLATTWDLASATPTWNGFIFRSQDGGSNWTKVGGPDVAPFTNDVGRMSIAVAPSNANTVYVLAAAASGNATTCADDPVDQTGVYRSSDGGLTWTFRSNQINGTCPNFTSILAGQGWYANSIVVDRTNPQVVYAGGLDVWKSTNGAATFQRISRWNLDPGNASYVHADIHDFAWVSGTPAKLLVGNDGGIEVTANQGTSFASMNKGAVTRQYYGIAITPASPPLVIAGAQDNGTDIRTGATSTYREEIGGDGFAVAAHPANANILYGSIYSSRIFRSTNGGQFFDEVTPVFDGDERRPFITPLTMDPVTPATLYTGSNFLWRTTNGGDTWSRTSNTDLGGGGRRGYITKIAVARSDNKQILIGSATGRVSRSTDGGATWTQMQGLPVRYVSHVEFDPTTPATFYVSVINTGNNGRVFKTTNAGGAFTQIDQGLPAFPVHVVRVDPVDGNILYAGTDVGLYRSINGGTTWTQFGGGLPAVSIWDIAIRTDGTILRLATHGRGIYEVRLRGGGRS